MIPGVYAATLQRAVEQGHLAEWHSDDEGALHLHTRDGKYLTFSGAEIGAFCTGLVVAS